MHYLIVVDMQEDFVRGSLANEVAVGIINNVKKVIDTHKGNIIFTLDTHDKNYLETQEGHKLPIAHTIKGTDGHKIIAELSGYLSKPDVSTLEKKCFGYYDWNLANPIQVTIVGTVTEICVVSNAMILKAKYPEVPIRVVANACAGLSPENHKAALAVMTSCQIEII
ncbi:MAG: cysteine hydrolase [Firmicutes bacterium]|nr:cysteine hydrolase [Bacillota bacterium]